MRPKRCQSSSPAVYVLDANLDLDSPSRVSNQTRFGTWRQLWLNLAIAEKVQLTIDFLNSWST